MNPILELLTKMDGQWLTQSTTPTTGSSPEQGSVRGFLAKALGMEGAEQSGPSTADRGALTGFIQSMLNQGPSTTANVATATDQSMPAAKAQASVRPSTGIGDPVATNIPPEGRALLNAISGPEANGQYDVRYSPKGGVKFTGNQHPNVLEPGPHGPSSAAGRYQFTGSTWRGQGGGDFTPEAQDNAAWNLAQGDYKRRTGKDLQQELAQNGLTDQTLRILGPTWQAFTKDSGRTQARGIYDESYGRFSQPQQGPQSKRMSNIQTDEGGDFIVGPNGERLSPDRNVDPNRWADSGDQTIAKGGDRMMDFILKNMPEDEVRKFGLEKLKREFHERQGLDYVSPDERHDDTQTEQQRGRGMGQGLPDADGFKGIERGMEDQQLQQDMYTNENAPINGGIKSMKINNPVDAQEYLYKDAASPGTTPASFEDKVNMAEQLGIIRPETAKIILAGTVTPLPISPSPNAGKSNTRQGTEEALDQINSGKGSNIKLMPIQQWQSYVTRRS